MAKELPRFFIASEKINDKKFSLEDPQDIHKIRSVLRLGPGDLIELISDKGEAFQAIVEKAEREEVTGLIKEKLELGGPSNVKQQSKPFIILAQALPKGPKMDDIIRMNTEIGVKKFIPFESDYSVIKLKDFNPKKLDRWGKIAKEAARQSEQIAIPEITSPMSFAEVLGIKADQRLLLHSRTVEGAININDIKDLIDPGSTILVLIGPEGGFSPKEIDLAKSQNCKIIHLDLPILRTETAGVVVSSILLS